MIDTILEKYSFKNVNLKLIRHNENMTYLLINDNKKYVLRIHKPIEGFNVALLRLGIEQNKYIKSEMELLYYLEKNSSLGTQTVVLNNENQMVTDYKNNTLATVITWVEGQTLEDVKITPEIAQTAGKMLGKLHTATNNIKFNNRYQYGGILLDRLLHESRSAIELKHFSEEHGKVITDTLILVKNNLIENEHRFSFVHSDLSKSNLLITSDKIVPIDFSLSGYCIPEMDISSLFSHFNDETVNNEILKGYLSESNNKINEYLVQICLCFQVLLFIVCQHGKTHTQPWFQDTLNRWCNDIFIPTQNKKDLKS